MVGSDSHKLRIRTRRKKRYLVCARQQPGMPCSWVRSSSSKSNSCSSYGGVWTSSSSSMRSSNSSCGRRLLI